MSLDARVGRPLAEGMALLRGARPASSPTVLALSLFTNDSPTSLDTLQDAVRRSVGLAGPHGCALWATIQRPPLNGTSYAAANRMLAELARDPALQRHLIVVPWQEQVAAHPGWLGGDGVHATPDGYAARAQLYADGARSCAV